MNYLLDTDTLIDFLKDHGSVRRRVTAMIEAGDTVGLCSVTVAETYTGLSASDQMRWQAFLRSLPFWDATYNVAVQAGFDRSASARVGKAISATDALVGAIARDHQAIVLTSNVKDYPLKDVQVLSLREEAA